MFQKSYTIHWIRSQSTWCRVEAAVQRCSVKKMFLEISQNSQENTCTRGSFLIKLQVSGLKLFGRMFLDCCILIKTNCLKLFSISA